MVIVGKEVIESEIFIIDIFKVGVLVICINCVYGDFIIWGEIIKRVRRIF